MQDIPVDLPDALWLQNYFAHYANPKARIERLLRQGLLFRLKRGLYIRPEAANDEYLLGKAANRLYGPSYVSFLYAMRWVRDDSGTRRPHHLRDLQKRQIKAIRYPCGLIFLSGHPLTGLPLRITFVGEGQSRFLIASAKRPFVMNCTVHPEFVP